MMLKNVKELWEEGRSLLPIDNFPEREAEILLIFLDILSIQRHELTFHRNTILNNTQQDKFYKFIQERSTHKPLAYILGYQYFYGKKFPVSPETLIPRFDTEILVESMLRILPNNQNLNILDICTGTGVIALTLAQLLPLATIKAIDIVSKPFLESQKALQLVEDRISFEEQDFLDMSLWEGEWDCIVSNPPYLDEEDMSRLAKQVHSFEPHSALYAQEGGMIFYKAIELFSRSHLSCGGMIFLEVDHKYTQVIQLFSDLYYEEPKIINDLSELPRVLVIKKRIFS